MESKSIVIRSAHDVSETPIDLTFVQGLSRQDILFQSAPAVEAARADRNRVAPQDHSIHDWYRFVLSFPPHLVRHYLQEFGMTGRHRVLDPFCGTGTTLVEAMKQGVDSVGAEPNPMAWFASKTKVDWDVDPEQLIDHAQRVAKRVQRQIADTRRGSQGEQSRWKSLPEDAAKLLLKGSISPLPLHKSLLLVEAIQQGADDGVKSKELLAFATALVKDIGNLHFGPEVGVGRQKSDAPVVSSWLERIHAMAADLRLHKSRGAAGAMVLQTDARRLSMEIAAQSVDAVITSPPYPNEKDYTRTTRLESILLGFIHNREELRSVKQELVRSNTRGVYKSDTDDQLVADHLEIQKLSQEIERRRIKLGKTSGFERMYPRVARLYFGGMTKHLSDIRLLLRPGARLAYVVGDQASYLQVLIRTGQLLAGIAESLGYEVVRIDLFRTRLSTATRQQLREEVVVLRWPGMSRGNRNRA